MTDTEPTPYRIERKVPGYTLVIDHSPCVEVAVGALCADCWLPLPEGHDWPQGDTLLPASSASEENP